jgi:hypothetical protein
MTEGILTPNLTRPDAFYEALSKAHEGLSDDESAALNARLILVLANQIGDCTLLAKAIAVAKDNRAYARSVEGLE